jgi:hypothetical protein
MVKRILVLSLLTLVNAIAACGGETEDGKEAVSLSETYNYDVNMTVDFSNLPQGDYKNTCGFCRVLSFNEPIHNTPQKYLSCGCSNGTNAPLNETGISLPCGYYINNINGILTCSND